MDRQPIPTGPERQGIYIEIAPGLYHGWQRRCALCCCSVGASHVPFSDDCDALYNERLGR